MAKGDILGAIPCPCCTGEMRITEDKNGHPFGFCHVGCAAQLRIGGNAARVEKFRARYPWAGGKPAAPAPVASLPAAPTAPKPAPKPATRPATRPAPEPLPAPAAKTSSFSDLLANFGR